VDLATRDTPEQLKRALQEAAARNPQQGSTASSGSDNGGLLSRIGSIFRRG
jgi:molecular chaperone DnaK